MLKHFLIENGPYIFYIMSDIFSIYWTVAVMERKEERALSQE